MSSSNKSTPMVCERSLTMSFIPSIVSLLDEASKNNVLNAIFISILKFSHKSSGKIQKRLSKHNIPFYLTYSFSKDYRVNDYK